VASDGPINEKRKRELIEWAASRGIPEHHCRFLTAFIGGHTRLSAGAFRT
jgi:hypothetical protein